MLLRFLVNKLEERDLLDKTDFYSHVESEFKQRRRTEALKNIGIGFAIGSVLTGLLALFLLPKSGKEFRSDVKHKVDKVARDVEDKTDKVKEKGEEILRKADRLFESKKKDVIDFAEDVEEGFEDFKEETKLAKLRAKLKAKSAKDDVEDYIEEKVDKAKDVKKEIEKGAEEVKDVAEETVEEIKKK
jgi:gas vesicle protein